MFDVEKVRRGYRFAYRRIRRYLLWVNGAEVGRGPIRSQPRPLRYDEYDIAAYLRPGRNVVAVLVTYYGHANSFWQPAASSGVMGRDAQLVLEARVGEEWLVTDERWRVLRSRRRALGAGQSLDAVPVELLDARELDPAWARSTSTTPPGPRPRCSRPAMTEHWGVPPVDPYGAMLPWGSACLAAPESWRPR